MQDEDAQAYKGTEQQVAELKQQYVQQQNKMLDVQGAELTQLQAQQAQQVAEATRADEQAAASKAAVAKAREGVVETVAANVARLAAAHATGEGAPNIRQMLPPPSLVRNIQAALNMLQSQDCQLLSCKIHSGTQPSPEEMRMQK